VLEEATGLVDDMGGGTAVEAGAAMLWVGVEEKRLEMQS
jgi:hypothetical protein